MQAPRTYHTRPMPEDWSKLRDIDPLADAGASLDYAIPLAEFPRLQGQLMPDPGEATGRVRFSREGGAAVAALGVHANPTLVCQRCLAPLRLPVDAEVKVALVGDAEEAERVSADLETVLAPGHRISLRDLVEEELLLSIPLVPLHEGGQCEAAKSAHEPASSAAASPPVQKPFERLGELLKRER